MTIKQFKTDRVNNFTINDNVRLFLFSTHENAKYGNFKAIV